MGRGWSRRDLRNGVTALAFLAPNLIGFLTFMLIPIVTGIVIAFSRGTE